ncbi:MAG: hypothetical protein K5930_11340 [Treponemataceae bacterium]|nr:hypothetical protein [Treponemataceae bacterium]
MKTRIFIFWNEHLETERQQGFWNFSLLISGGCGGSPDDKLERMERLGACDNRDILIRGGRAAGEL